MESQAVTAAPTFREALDAITMQVLPGMVGLETVDRLRSLAIAEFLAGKPSGWYGKVIYLKFETDETTVVCPEVGDDLGKALANIMNWLEAHRG